MIKSLLTGQEIRHNAKKRLIKHRQTMAKQGYKTVSIFMGELLRTELDRLGATGLTRHESLEHIFDIYKKAMNKAKDTKSSGTKDLEASIDIKGVACNTKEKGKNSKQFDLFNPDKVEPDPLPTTAKENNMLLTIKLNS